MAQGRSRSFAKLMTCDGRWSNARRMAILSQCRLRKRNIEPGYPWLSPDAPTLWPSITPIVKRAAPRQCSLSGCHGIPMNIRYAWPETALSLGSCTCGGCDPPRALWGLPDAHEALTVSCRPDELPSDQIGPARFGWIDEEGESCREVVGWSGYLGVFRLSSRLNVARQRGRQRCRGAGSQGSRRRHRILFRQLLQAPQ